MLDPIIKTIEVSCNQRTAFEVFVDFKSWWPLDKRSMSAKDGETAKSISVDATLGGEIYEQSESGIRHLWGTITSYDPYAMFAMNFHMGLPPCDSKVEIIFKELAQNKTQVTLTQSNWEAFGEMAEMMRGGYGSSWGLLFEEAYLERCRAEGSK